MPSEPASASLTVLPVLEYLAAAGDYLKIKPPATWTPVNPTQTRFLDLYGSRLSQLDSLGDQLQRKADRDPSVINKWLAEKGWPDVKIPDDAAGPDGFCAAAILDVLVEWVKLGNRTFILKGEKRYDAVGMPAKTHGVSAFRVSNHDAPIVKLETKTADTHVYLTAHIDPTTLNNPEPRTATPRCQFPNDKLFLKRIARLAHRSPVFYYQTLRIPRDPKDAVQDEEQGARAESAAAVAMKRSRPVGEWVTIDKPFLLWIEKRGEVVFGGWFEEGCWADPGSLDS